MMMKKVVTRAVRAKIGVFVSLAVCASLQAEVEIDLTTQPLGDAVELIEADDEPPHLRVTGSAGQPPAIQLFEIADPDIDTDAYEIVGEVRHSGVTGDGFLEMWSHLPAKRGESEIAASFFSRTLALSGPMAKLTGDADWRPFQLPAIVNDGSGRRPLKLTVNVVLPDGGSVEVRRLKLRAAPGLTATVGSGGIALGFYVLIGGLGLALGAGLVVLICLIRRQRSASELRRIQAADS